MRAIEACQAAVVALIEGTVWGGACELALTCDLLVAAPDVTFAITPARLGLPYNLSGVLNFLKVIGLPLLKEMMFTASPISAERALAAGMLNHVVAKPDLETFAYELAGRICQTSPLSVAVSKEELRMLSESNSLTAQDFERVQALRRQVYTSHDYQEGLRAFSEKRKPNFTGE